MAETCCGFMKTVTGHNTRISDRVEVAWRALGKVLRSFRSVPLLQGCSDLFGFTNDASEKVAQASLSL